MNKTLIFAGILIVVLLLGGGVLLLVNSNNNSNTTSGTNTPTNSIVNNTNVTNNTTTNNVSQSAILIQNNAFSPSTLTVKIGTVVTWTNRDGYAHTITDNNGTFNSGNIADGGTFSHTFSSAGTYSYHCAIHPYMTGEVIVTQ